ncbi:MAG: hypothetical protein AB1704_20585 [Pseudomonadota bacterium]|jgi:hypothetical protein
MHNHIRLALPAMLFALVMLRYGASQAQESSTKVIAFPDGTAVLLKDGEVVKKVENSDAQAFYERLSRAAFSTPVSQIGGEDEPTHEPRDIPPPPPEKKEPLPVQPVRDPTKPDNPCEGKPGCPNHFDGGIDATLSGQTRKAAIDPFTQYVQMRRNMEQDPSMELPDSMRRVQIFDVSPTTFDQAVQQ